MEILDEAGQALLVAARAAWPGLAAIDEELCGAVLAAAAAEGRPVPPERGVELVLATACARGDAEAIAVLEARFFPELGRLVQKRVRSFALRDEILQHVRALLLVGRADKRPELADFRGAGPLAGWLRIVAMRVLLRFVQKEERSVALPDAVKDRLAAREDLDLRLIEERYAGAVEEGMQEAFRRCTPRERNLLRYRYVDSCSIDQVATICNVHRATAARWLNDAEETLIGTCLEVLAARFQVSADEMKSVLKLIRSRIDLSVKGIFKT